MNEISCGHCGSNSVIKYGKYKGTQYYLCKSCGRRFASSEKIPKMHHLTRTVADALNMYYEGKSLSEIRRTLIQEDRTYVSRISAYNWVRRFSKLAIDSSRRYRANVGGVWVVDEAATDIDGTNVWVRDILDIRTRFLIASRMSTAQTGEDAQALMKQACDLTGRIPRTIYTGRLQPYLEGTNLVAGGQVKRIQASHFGVANKTNVLRSFRSIITERSKVVRRMKSMENAEEFIQGWLIHYNFFRPNLKLGYKTPAEVARVKFPFRNWKDIVEQPYAITARIPLQVSTAAPQDAPSLPGRPTTQD